MSEGEGWGTRRRRPAGQRGRGSPRRGPQGGRRPPPPEETGAETQYLVDHKERRVPMVVRLRDGEVLRGTIEYYDRNMIKITREDGPNLFVRKTDIRTLHAEDDTGG